MKFRLENEKIGLKVTSLQCKCQIRLMIDQGDLMIPKPICPQNQIKRTTESSGRPVVEGTESGCKNSGKIWWMMKFQYTEILTRVLLVNHLQSLRLREVRIWVNTVFILTSLKSEIARSVKGPKLQGPHAEDAMAEPYLVLKILVT